MDGHYIRGVGDHAGEAEIVVIAEALQEAERFLEAEGETEVRHRVDRVAELIEGFETPYGMELLSTVHWVAKHPPFAKTREDAVSAVHQWNDRKRQMLKEHHIKLAWHRLDEGGWLRSV